MSDEQVIKSKSLAAISAIVSLLCVVYNYHGWVLFASLYGLMAYTQDYWYRGRCIKDFILARKQFDDYLSQKHNTQPSS